MLLYTRKLILDREFLPERCGTLAELAEVLARGPLDLVLICQSVPDAECQEVIETVRMASPEVKVLVLQAGDPGSRSLHSDAAIENLEGPSALLREIHALLGMGSTGNASPA
jgi:hypothetical protein